MNYFFLCKYLGTLDYKDGYFTFIMFPTSREELLFFNQLKNFIKNNNLNDYFISITLSKKTRGNIKQNKCRKKARRRKYNEVIKTPIYFHTKQYFSYTDIKDYCLQIFFSEKIYKVIESLNIFFDINSMWKQLGKDGELRKPEVKIKQKT